MGWLGALAVLLGVAFFIAIAIGRGWLGETARIALAYVGSGGSARRRRWLHEKRGRTQASLAMVGTGVASAFMTTTAAIQLYHLFPAPAGLVIAFAIGSIATLLAIHWNSRTIAGIGIIGALLAPVMVGAGASDAGIGFVAIALAAATGVLLWRKWEWLALAAFAVSAPQLVAWTDQADSAVAIVVVGLAFWGLYMVAALGYDLRVKGALPRTTACLLAIAAPLLASAGGYWALRSLGHSAAGDWLIAGLGLAHIALGFAARRSTKVSIEVERLLFAGGLAMANTAYGLIASGPAVSIGWAASAVGLGFLARKGKLDRELTTLALGAQLCLSLLHTLLFDAPPADTLATLTGGSSAVASLGAGRRGVRLRPAGARVDDRAHRLRRDRAGGARVRDAVRRHRRRRDDRLGRSGGRAGADRMLDRRRARAQRRVRVPRRWRSWTRSSATRPCRCSRTAASTPRPSPVSAPSRSRRTAARGWRSRCPRAASCCRRSRRRLSRT